ncbi:MAG TPA: hypothetical protein VFX24_13845 [Ktedonobacterales bacterium]|nr:hypothetical protein [Ktedonobacterales bacterium]
MARKFLETDPTKYWGGRGAGVAKRKYAKSTGIPRRKHGPRLKARVRLFKSRRKGR